MKIRHSLKSVKARHKDSRIVRRKGRVYVINKTNPRFKARQGSAAERRSVFLIQAAEASASAAFLFGV